MEELSKKEKWTYYGYGVFTSGFFWLGYVAMQLWGRV